MRSANSRHHDRRVVEPKALVLEGVRQDVQPRAAGAGPLNGQLDLAPVAHAAPEKHPRGEKDLENRRLTEPQAPLTAACPSR